MSTLLKRYKPCDARKNTHDQQNEMLDDEDDEKNENEKIENE